MPLKGEPVVDKQLSSWAGGEPSQTNICAKMQKMLAEWATRESPYGWY